MSSLSPADFGAAAPSVGGRRRRSRRGGDELVAGRRRRSRRGGDEMVAGRRRHRGGADMPAPPPAEVKEDATQLAGADAPKTLEGGRRRHTKAKKVAKALLKLSKKLGARRRGGSSMY
jgi:hypothetical protein